MSQPSSNHPSDFAAVEERPFHPESQLDRGISGMVGKFQSVFMSGQTLERGQVNIQQISIIRQPVYCAASSCIRQVLRTHSSYTSPDADSNYGGATSLDKLAKFKVFSFPVN